MSSKTASTEPTWPANAIPTPEQLVVWLRRCTPAELLHFVTVALRNEQRSHDCFVCDHEGEIEFLNAEIRRLNADLENAGGAS